MTPPSLGWRFGDPIAPVVECLGRGGAIVFPTESSYGLGVDPRNAAGVEAIYRFKERERAKPLPVVVADLAQLSLLGIDPDDPLLLRIAPHWPAPLTAVLATGEDLPAGAGTRTLAVRIPRHDGLRELLRSLGHPLTATSANPSGGAPWLDIEEVRAGMRGADWVVVQGGRLPGGAPSTVVSAEGVLREGAFRWPPQSR